VEEAEYRKMFEYEATHWWFRGKRAIVASMIDRYATRRAPVRLLDVGCGTGATLRDLARRGAAYGTDLHPLALGFCRARGVENLANADAARLPFGDATFDVVLALDVLYHRRVPDVVGTLRELYRVCKAGGLLVITDSALGWLAGPHDAALHGARRFGRRALAADVRQAGFAVVRCSYMNTLLFPLAAAARLVERVRFRGAPHSSMGPVHPVVNRVLARVYRAEARLLGHVDLPIGLSVLLVARKATA
jgi:SAM-dependent methyltransferase